MKKPSFLLIIVISIILIPTFFFCDFVKEKVLVLMFGEDTVYVENFNEKEFFDIKIGMSREEVLKILGPPLEKAGGEKYWHYSWYRSGNFLKRVIIFDETNKVKKVKRGLYLD